MNAMTPQGVEHLGFIAMISRLRTVMNAMTPQGVEHVPAGEVGEAAKRDERNDAARR